MNQSTPAVGSDDIALMVAHRDGDEAAFASLMQRYDTRLRGMCWRYMRDASIVDDLVQETFCHVLEHIERVDRIDGSFNFAAWVHRIAANLCTDELRRRTRRARMQMVGDDNEAVVTRIVDNDRWGRPEDALELDLTRSMVRAAILQLPERQRDVLFLRDVCGLSETATATSLGLSTGAVQGTLHRGRERFKTCYVSIESGGERQGECGSIAFILENLRLGSLRRDRLQTIERHIASCDDCRACFDGAVLDAVAAAMAGPERSDVAELVGARQAA